MAHDEMLISEVAEIDRTDDLSERAAGHDMQEGSEPDVATLFSWAPNANPGVNEEE